MDWTVAVKGVLTQLADTFDRDKWGNPWTTRARAAWVAERYELERAAMLAGCHGPLASPSNQARAVYWFKSIQGAPMLPAEQRSSVAKVRSKRRMRRLLRRSRQTKSWLRKTRN